MVASSGWCITASRPGRAGTTPSDGSTSTCSLSRATARRVSPRGHRRRPWPKRCSTSETPTHRPSPDAAFLALLHKVPGAFSDDADQTLVADGQLACTGLAHEQGADDVIDSLTGRGLDQFEASLVAITATEHFCPQDGLQALKDVQEALTQGPA